MVIHFHFKAYFFSFSLPTLFYFECLSGTAIKVFENCLFSAQQFVVLLVGRCQTIKCNQQLEPQEIVRISTPKRVDKPQTIILFRMKMVFIVISHFPLIIEQCIGKPSIYSQIFKNCVHPVPRFQSASSVHFVKSFSNGILHPDKQTYPGFPPFNFLGIHFYTCINSTEKTVASYFI